MKLTRLAPAILWLGLSLLVSPAAMAQDDPFQRHITFFNDSPVTIWPVFQVPQDANCKGELAGKELRLHVNHQTRDAGIPSRQSVEVALPKEWPCKTGGFYNAARIFLFAANARALEAEILKKHPTTNQTTTPFNAGLVTPICGKDLQTDPCWTGTAGSGYALDSPAQLLEYTIISQAPDGSAFSDANNAQGVPFLDFDVSYVDEVYLPASMTIDTGAVQFMGSSLSYDEFNTRLGAFITETKWPLWGAYADLNFKITAKGTIFVDLLKQNSVGQHPRIPSGHQSVEATDDLKATKCFGTLEPVGRGNRNAYTNVEDKCPDTDAGRLIGNCGRPLADLAVPPLIP